MSNSSVVSSEFEQQKAQLFSKVGEPGSGAGRYAAAMYFYNQGRISVELLEIYRRCSKFDFEDPVKLARHEGLEVPMEQHYENGKFD